MVPETPLYAGERLNPTNYHQIPNSQIKENLSKTGSLALSYTQGSTSPHFNGSLNPSYLSGELQSSKNKQKTQFKFEIFDPGSDRIVDP